MSLILRSPRQRASEGCRCADPVASLGIPVSRTFTIFNRELASYFTTPLAYVFIVIFLVLAGVLTFFVGDFFERGQADLQPFFTFHPWLYLVLVPALAMRLWAEERKTGTIELFLTLPIRLGEAVLGKFLAAWFFRRHRARPDLPVLADGQLSRRSRTTA